MSWMQKLYKTHEAIVSLPGSDDYGDSTPESHTTARVHIEIVLDGEGNFKRAAVVDKTDATTVIPCTEDSAARAGTKPAPHPLCDALQYIAADFREHGGRVTSGFEADTAEPHKSYAEQLGKWGGISSHPKTKAVLAYVRRGKVIEDLLKHGTLPIDSAGDIQRERPISPKEQHPIWSVIPAGQAPDKAVVRWRVEIEGEPASGSWEDHGLIENWKAYYPTAIEVEDLCMVRGEKEPLASFHPAKLRHAGDKAKLISSNDSSGFTFRGKFTDKKQACGVGYEVTQKAHSALRWLITRQGYRNGSQVFVSWAVSGKPIPQPLNDSYGWLDEPAELPLAADGATDQYRDLGQSFALKLGKYMAGYRQKIRPTEEIVILGLDAATPGRMSITYHRELLGSEFLDQIEQWHCALAWPQRRTLQEQNPGRGRGSARVVWDVRAPVPRGIAEAAYGRRLDDKLKRATVERLLPCIVEGQPLPRDLVESATKRAANRHGMDNWEWEKTLGVACALFKGYFSRNPNPEQRRDYTMGLDENCTSRDYLYGRLLAIAERIESIALHVANEKRPTTAARMMQRFADHPNSTWRTIELSLQPYMQRLQSSRGGFLHNMCELLDKVCGMFQKEEFQSERPLSGEFLLGYHCQRLEWNKDKDKSVEKEGDE
jgi:CRISPR-associated protein Csd1